MRAVVALGSQQLFAAGVLLHLRILFFDASHLLLRILGGGARDFGRVLADGLRAGTARLLLPRPLRTGLNRGGRYVVLWPLQQKRLHALI